MNPKISEKIKTISYIFLIGAIVFAVSKLIGAGIVPISSNAIYGPFRWWNNEVFKLHTLDIINNYSSKNGVRALFAPSLPVTVAEGYIPNVNSSLGIDGGLAGADLRFVPGGSAYTSYPPLAFVLTWILSGAFKLLNISRNTIDSLTLINVLIFTSTAYFFSTSSIMWLKLKSICTFQNKLIVLTFTNLILIFSPLPLYMLGIPQLWVHQWILLLVSLSIYAIFRSNNWTGRILALCIIALPAISYTAVPIQLGLIFTLIKLKKISRLKIFNLTVLPNLFLFAWGSIAFQNPTSWLQAIFARSTSRIMVADVKGDSIGYFGSLVNLSKSLVLSFGFTSLIVIVLNFIFIRNYKHLKNSFSKNRVFIVIAATSALEFLIFPGHAFVYSFAQVMLIPILWVFGMIPLMYLFKRLTERNYQYFFTFILLLITTAFINYGVTKIIYNSVQSFDVVTNEGLKTYQYEHT